MLGAANGTTAGVFHGAGATIATRAMCAIGGIDMAQFQTQRLYLAAPVGPREMLDAIAEAEGAGAGSILIAWGDDNVAALARMNARGLLWRAQ
jgi:hypothetical protein